MNQFDLSSIVAQPASKSRTKTAKLTPEETFLGRVYSLIHQRAQYLRQQQAAANARNDRGEAAMAATQTSQPNRRGPSL